MDKNKITKAMLLGLGFDCKDGHLRVTKGNNFQLYGGSESTHNAMMEKAMKFNEQMVKSGKQLDNISEQEFYDIAHKVGFKINEPGPN